MQDISEIVTHMHCTNKNGVIFYGSTDPIYYLCLYGDLPTRCHEIRLFGNSIPQKSVHFTSYPL